MENMKLGGCITKETCLAHCLLFNPYRILFTKQFCYNFFSVLSLVYLRDLTV